MGGGIVQCFRAAVPEMPYPSISVTLLCQRAGIARKVFYQQFQSKSDVLRHVVDVGVVQPERELLQLLTLRRISSHAPEMERRMFRAVADDAAFYRALVTVSPEGALAFAHQAENAFCSFNAEVLREAAFTGGDLQANYVASYFAAAKAQMMLKWISEGFPLSPDDAADLYSRMALPYWRSLV